MDENTLKLIAAQLRKPTGPDGIETGERMNVGNLLINLNTIESMDLQPGDEVMEIGMGNGHFVKNILDVNDSITYTGYDFSPDMIFEAKLRNEKYITEGRASFILGDVATMPFRDNSFNKILTINTIYFWYDPEKVLAEICRILKPGGKTYIAIRPRSSMQLYPFVKYGFNMFSKEELSDLLSANNFAVLEVIEKEEPSQDRFGTEMVVETLIVIGQKNSNEI